MADNIPITPGSGATVATDEVGSRHFQLIKPAFGVDGEATLVSADNPLPVHDEDNHAMMSRVFSALESPRGYDKSIQRQRGTVIVESGTMTTVITVTTVTTVTNLTNIDGIQGRIQVYGANLSAWADCVRARIS